MIPVTSEQIAEELPVAEEIVNRLHVDEDLFIGGVPADQWLATVIAERVRETREETRREAHR